MNVTISKYSGQRLKDLFCYLYENNRYYYNLMIHLDCNPCQKIASDLYKQLPYLQKEDIIKQGKEYYSQSFGEVEIKETVTSGTSGKVLSCYKTKKESSILAINVWAQRLKIDPNVTPENYINIFSDEVETLIGSFYDVNQEALIDHFSKIMTLQPRWLSGPVSIIERFAILIEKGCLKYESLTIKVIEFMGEFVSDAQRKMIERVFKCRTVNHYGTQETWCVAYECEEGNLHVQTNNVIVEIKNQNCDGMGEVVITSLVNHYMPIIKYQIGDIGRISDIKCGCNNHSPVLEVNSGRKNDLIYGRNLLGNYFFDQLIWDVNKKVKDSIFIFQVFQIKPKTFRIKIVKGNKYDGQVEDIIRGRICKEIGEDYSVEFEFADSLKLCNTGKLKKFTSYNPENDARQALL